MTTNQKPLDEPVLLLKAAAVLMRHRMLTEPDEPVPGGGPGWLERTAGRREHDGRLRPWVLRAATRALEESRTAERGDAPPRHVFEELLFAAGRARRYTRRAGVILRALYDIVGATKPFDDVLIAQTVRAGCANAIIAGRLTEPPPGQSRNGADPYWRETEECLETLHQTLGTSDTPGGPDRNRSKAHAVRAAAREILIRRGSLPAPAEAPPTRIPPARPDDPLLRPENEKPCWRRAELPKEWLTLAFNDDPSGLDDEEHAKAQATLDAEFTRKGYEITSAAGDGTESPPTEKLDGRWEGQFAEGCTLEYLGYSPEVMEKDLARGLHCPLPVDGAEYLLHTWTEDAVWLPCNWTSLIEQGRWQHTPDDGDPWTDEVAEALGPDAYDRWRRENATGRPVRRLGAYPHVRTGTWNGQQVETTLWLVSTDAPGDNPTRWPEKAPPLPTEIRAELDDLPFTCPMCGITDDTVPDPTTLEPDEAPLCDACGDDVPGWGDAYDSWPESPAAASEGVPHP